MASHMSIVMFTIVERYRSKFETRKTYLESRKTRLRNCVIIRNSPAETSCRKAACVHAGTIPKKRIVVRIQPSGRARIAAARGGPCDKASC
jgi:hypothetical protein